MTCPSCAPRPRWLEIAESVVGVLILLAALYGVACLLTRQVKPTTERTIQIEAEEFRQWLKAGVP